MPTPSKPELRTSDTDRWPKAGTRRPILLEGFHLREQTTHVDHERIPERVVHARDAAVQGVFESYRPNRLDEGEPLVATTEQGGYRHCKALAYCGDGETIRRGTGLALHAPGVLLAEPVAKDFTEELATALGFHLARDRAELVMNSSIAPAC